MDCYGETRTKSPPGSDIHSQNSDKVDTKKGDIYQPVPKEEQGKTNPLILTGFKVSMLTPSNSTQHIDVSSPLLVLF